MMMCLLVMLGCMLLQTVQAQCVNQQRVTAVPASAITMTFGEDQGTK